VPEETLPFTYGTSEREGSIFRITDLSAINGYLKLYSGAYC